MADLNKHEDKKDWLTWAIEFMRRGLWLDEEITVHGPHDSSNAMWGSAFARKDGHEWWPECSFRADAKHGMYRPIGIRIWITDEESCTFPLLKTSELTPKAQKWLRTSRRTLKKLRSG